MKYTADNPPPPGAFDIFCKRERRMRLIQPRDVFPTPAEAEEDARAARRYDRDQFIARICRWFRP